MKSVSSLKGKGASVILLIFGTVLFLFVANCGCILDSPRPIEKDRAQFADKVNASQDYYDNLVKDDSLNATAWCIRGNYYNNAFGQYEKALESYNRSLELDPGYGYAWFSKGVTLRNMGYYSESEECFEKALNIDPSLRHVTDGLMRTKPGRGR